MIICKWEDGHIEAAEIDEEGLHWLDSEETLSIEPVSWAHIPEDL